MPIPKITDQIAAASTPLVLGWSLLHFVGSRSQSTASGTGVNYFFDFEAELGPGNSDMNKGRKVTYMVSGGALEAAIEQVCAPYNQMLCALTGLTTKELVGVDVTDQMLAGKKCWADVQERIVEGKPYKDFKGFAPEGNIPF